MAKPAPKPAKTTAVEKSLDAFQKAVNEGKPDCIKPALDAFQQADKDDKK